MVLSDRGALTNFEDHYVYVHGAWCHYVCVLRGTELSAYALPQIQSSELQKSPREADVLLYFLTSNA